MLHKCVRYSVYIAIGCIMLVAGVYLFVSGYSKRFIYANLDEVPHKHAALVLGTNKYLTNGQTNDFYRYRIEAAAALWKRGKIDAIIVSGDNSTKHYNEPAHMYRDLVKAGVPKRFIAKDYAGFRTLDSIIRAGIDFGLNDYIIVSQRFHLERALYIAHTKGQRAIGYVAKGKGLSIATLKMIVREMLARVVMLLDVYVLKTQPKYYGGKMEVQYRTHLHPLN